jgi:hypothetical protein
MINKLKKYYNLTDKGILILFLIFLIFTPFFLTPWIHGNDGAGYYSYLRSAFIDHDLDLKNEKEQFNQTIRISSIMQDPNTDKYFSQYPIGTALLWTPFFLVGHSLAFLFNQELDGYSIFYTYGICLGSAIYGFLGLVLLYCTLKKYFKKKIALISILTIWLSTNIFYYMYFESSMSHANSFFSISLLLFFWDKNFKKRTLLGWALIGGLCGLATLIRYQNIVFTFLPIIEFLSISLPLLFIKKIKYIKREILNGFVCLLTFLIIMVPQLILLKIKHGSFIIGYSGNFFITHIPQNMINTLFANRNGIFNWFPILIFAFIGLFFFSKKQKLFSYTYIIIFIFNWLIISGWTSWYGGQAFGNRLFIDTFPLLIFGFAALISQLNKYINLKYITFICLFFIMWNFGLMIQYGSRMILTNSVSSPFIERAYNNLMVVPRKFFIIARSFLFSRQTFLI